MLCSLSTVQSSQHTGHKGDGGRGCGRWGIIVFPSRPPPPPKVNVSFIVKMWRSRYRTISSMPLAAGIILGYRRHMPHTSFRPSDQILIMHQVQCTLYGVQYWGKYIVHININIWQLRSLSHTDLWYFVVQSEDYIQSLKSTVAIIVCFYFETIFPGMPIIRAVNILPKVCHPG